nr:synapse differentiation-inducing gene protein 1 isoform X2 [Columba livia]
MDGLVEKNSVLMHNKIAEAGKRNGLINTRNLVAESRDGLVSVYPTPQYQSHRASSLSSPNCLENGRNDPVQQLLDPNMLQQTVESHYRPNIILYSENVLHSWGDSIGPECCETTFIEDRSPTKDSLEYPDSKFIDLTVDDIKIHTLSYDVEEEEDFQELETNKAIAKGDFHHASSSSRRALFLAVLSITIGTGIYVGVAVALIAYLSKNNHL